MMYIEPVSGLACQVDVYLVLVKVPTIRFYKITRRLLKSLTLISATRTKDFSTPPPKVH